MSRNGQNGQAEGNTNSRPSVAFRWSFTLNNWEADDFSKMVRIFEVLQCKYIIGKEVGESGTPHLQGYVESPKAVRWTAFKLTKKIHWEKSKGDRDDNFKYCSKDGDITTNIRKPRTIKTPILYGWQEKLRDKLMEDPDDRTIEWVWSKNGAMGKSTFVRYMVIKHEAIVCSGKASDMKFQIAEWEKKKGYFPDIVMFDVPRSSKQYISYTGIEEIKNGVFSSSKYESTMITMPHPHVVVLCNFEPDYNDEDLSSDRICELCVDHPLLVEEDDSLLSARANTKVLDPIINGLQINF